MNICMNSCELLVRNSQAMHGNEIFAGRKLLRHVKYTVSLQCIFPLSLGVVEMLT